MPQRTRPRLKRTLIACSWCGASTVKLYPSRESVRRKLSPYRFCSSTCQRDHWEARRKAAWNVQPYPCAHCGGLIIPLQAAGRRRSYCVDSCKSRAARDRQLRQPSGAVAAARERFDQAWQRAVQAVNAWGEFEDLGAPVEAAYIKASRLHPSAQSQQDKKNIVRPVCEAIYALTQPRYKDEPGRHPPAAGLFTEWRNWWLEGRTQRWRHCERRLELARAATAELRKREKVAARRAETARLRRAAAQIGAE